MPLVSSADMRLARHPTGQDCTMTGPTLILTLRLNEYCLQRAYLITFLNDWIYVSINSQLKLVQPSVYQDFTFVQLLVKPTRAVKLLRKLICRITLESWRDPDHGHFVFAVIWQLF